jgi:hypothetical protein
LVGGLKGLSELEAQL